MLGKPHPFGREHVKNHRCSAGFLQVSPTKALTDPSWPKVLKVLGNRRPPVTRCQTSSELHWDLSIKKSYFKVIQHPLPSGND